MNGRLHLGHAFSFTKADFTARFQRLLGKNVLLPFGFHCTGMPIQAAANKLRDELIKYGNPPVFPKEVVAEPTETLEKEEETTPASTTADAASQIAAKAKGKKTKLEVKGLTAPKSQWDILKSMGIPEEELPSFADPLKWLKFFPPFGATDLKAFGSGIDWRRSFITTSANPYYDAFIRWQFNRLKEGNRIKFGKRANVYSVLDGQVCADHDRATGEGVGPQEYTIIKLLILGPYPANSPLNSPVLVGKNIYLAPATLRPETMYGQTNCFVLPDGEYGTYEISNGDVLVMSARAARGLAHQGYMAKWGTAECLVKVKGSDLLGLPLKAPNCPFERVYTLPLLTISMSKGTGVVTSVPSDAPDDYTALRALQQKPAFREKYGITSEMVDPYQVVPIIEIEGYGTTSAVTMCERLDIQSPNDTEKLKKAKDEVYLKGFYDGVMLVGDCKGMKVCDAKPIIRNQLIASGDAIPYFEPESNVMSRSGDECVVALTDQWYLAYGDPEWSKLVSDHIHSNNFNGYNDKIMEQFDFVLGWLKEWACSRQFGLGTQLPWDTQWVIESLSDSTIYMAYYTIAQFLHNGVENLDGITVPNSFGILPEDLNDDVFNYIFLSVPLTVHSNIPMNVLNEMKAEFDYWYPFDLRVSAKDLIPNHLTMSLYNHIEIFKSRPDKFPGGIYCNGHIMVDAMKMSKSNGNFIMMLKGVEDFTADATRFGLADAGDSMEDANFDRWVTTAAISELYNEENFAKEMIADIRANKLRSDTSLFVWFDRVFMNEIDYLVDATKQEFLNMRYRDGIHRGYYDMMIIRDVYRDWSARCGIPMHSTAVMKFIEAVTIIMSPITPHWSENIWRFVLCKPGSVVTTSWPAYVPYNPIIRKEYLFFKDFMKRIKGDIVKAKFNPVGADGVNTKAINVFISSIYSETKKSTLRFLQEQVRSNTDGKCEFPADLIKRLQEFLSSDAELKKETKALMQFGAFMRDECLERGLDAIAIDMSYDQKRILQDNSEFIAKALEIAHCFFYNESEVATGASNIDQRRVVLATPGKPSYQFLNV